MTTEFFRTTSNEVQVTDKEAVADILSDYRVACHPDLTTEDLLSGDTFAIITPDMPNNGFYVNKVVDDEIQHEVTEEMYERLAPYLTELLTVTTVQTAGPSTTNTSITISPDGEITREDNTASEQSKSPSGEMTVEEAKERYLNGDLSTDDATNVEPDKRGFDVTFTCKNGYFVVTERVVETNTETPTQAND